MTEHMEPPTGDMIEPADDHWGDIDDRLSGVVHVRIYFALIMAALGAGVFAWFINLIGIEWIEAGVKAAGGATGASAWMRWKRSSTLICYGPVVAGIAALIVFGVIDRTTGLR